MVTQIMRSRIAIGIAGFCAFVVPFYIGNVYFGGKISEETRKKMEESFSHFLSEKEIVDTYNKNAESYKLKLDVEERLTGVKKLRKGLLEENAEGVVLEVAAGGGRNSTFWDWNKMSHLTMCDISPEMLRIARNKIKSLHTSEYARWKKIQLKKSGMSEDDAKKQNKFLIDDFLNEKFRFLIQDAQHLKFENESFDTVVDTFGLCSVHDPAEALKEMFRVTKVGGKILLLEHGRSHQTEWINNFLDRRAEKRAKKEACMWNRDLPVLLRKTLGRSVEIDDIKFAHLGTIYSIVLKKVDKDIISIEKYSKLESI